MIWLEAPDRIAKIIWREGFGEMGLIGTAAAIANAIFNADKGAGKPDRPVAVRLKKDDAAGTTNMVYSGMR